MKVGDMLPISVYGATGHTGRLVATELAARGHDVVLAGRDSASLDALAGELGGSAQVRVAGLDDHAALRKAADGSAVLINCAGRSPAPENRSHRPRSPPAATTSTTPPNPCTSSTCSTPSRAGRAGRTSWSSRA